MLLHANQAPEGVGCKIVHVGRALTQRVVLRARVQKRHKEDYHLERLGMLDFYNDNSQMTDFNMTEPTEYERIDENGDEHQTWSVDITFTFRSTPLPTAIFHPKP